MPALPDPPKLLYQTEVRRGRHWRRLFTLLLGIGAAWGAYWALSYARRQGVNIEIPLFYDGGRLIAAVLAGYLMVLAGLTVFRALTHPTARIQVFNRGISWRTPKLNEKIVWSHIVALYERADGVYLGSRPLLQWGAHEIITDAGDTFRFGAKHGDPRQFIRYVRPYVARLTGTQMGQALRSEASVEVHPKLTLWPGGVEARGKEIPWEQLDIQIKRRTLHIRQLQPNRKFKTVARFPIGSIKNLGGVMEIASATIRNHQPERFRRAAQARAEADARSTAKRR